MAKKKSKYSFINEVYEGALKAASTNRKGEVRIKRSDLKATIEAAFINGAKAAASGERVRFPVIGALVRESFHRRTNGNQSSPSY
jgi:hypothetical protein